MTNPYSPPRSEIRDPQIAPSGGRGVWLLRGVAGLTIVSGLITYVGVVRTFATDDFPQSLPGHVRYVGYLMPGVFVAAGVALILRSKHAVVLYTGHFILTLLGPAIVYPLYADPYLPTSLLDVYRRAFSLPAIAGWSVEATMFGYVWWLYKRGRLS